MDVLVVAFTGEDSPGLVHALAEVVSDHHGNWECSQMTSVGGVFAGNLVVSVEPERIEALMEDLRALDGMLDLSVRRARGTEPGHDTGRVLQVEIDGGDHPGIVEQFAAAVARPRVNVHRLDSRNVDPSGDGHDPRTGPACAATDRHCRVSVTLELGDDVDDIAMRQELLALADSLGVRLRFGTER